jgi:hypothetical protein
MSFFTRLDVVLLNSFVMANRQLSLDTILVSRLGDCVSFRHTNRRNFGLYHNAKGDFKQAFSRSDACLVGCLFSRWTIRCNDLGNLTSVVAKEVDVNLKTIDYVIGGFGCRVGRRVNGTFENKPRWFKDCAP